MTLSGIFALLAAVSTVLALLLLFRRTVPWVWKVSALGIACFYLIWFRADLAQVSKLTDGDLGVELPRLAAVLLQFAGLLLLALWPLTLLGAVFGRSRERVTQRLQKLSVATALVWMLFIADAFTPPFAGGWIRSAQQQVQKLWQDVSKPPTNAP